MEELITLTEAARRARYRSTSTLRAAAQSGALKTQRVSERVQLTTQAWLDEYLRTVRPGKPGKGYHRGQQRGSSNAGETAEQHMYL
jgi:hypothetical protein